MPRKPCSYTIEREGAEVILNVNCIGCIYYPSIEDNEICMERVISYIIEGGKVTTVTLSAERNYVYAEEQAQMLNEIAELYIRLVKDLKIASPEGLVLSPECTRCLGPWLLKLRKIVFDMIKRDPIGAYVETVRTLREERASLARLPEKCVNCKRIYLHRLELIRQAFENTLLIQKAKDKLPGHKVGDRSIYREIFEPMIRPNFMYTRLMTEIPLNAEEIDSYVIGLEDKSEVSIFKIPNKVALLYHLMPPEFQLSEEEYILLDEARETLLKYKPKEAEFVDPRRLRQIFFNVSRDLIEELCRSKKIKLEYKEIEKLARILVRLTVGFGLVEVLLEDDKIEDVYVNAPVGTVPIFVKHSKYGECVTNIIPNIREADAWASRFRLMSGRPLDEANPVLDTELVTKSFRARVAVIQHPLSPKGYAFAFRRHRAKPWTLPLFIHERMLSPLCAGLLWFLVDAGRCILIAGTRGAGKTSLLGSLIAEIPRRYRIIVIEDTLELPVDYFRNLHYDILSMKVRSAIVGEKTEMSADDGIRTSLRLGDSCLIVGEIRSIEAKALFEAMRIGALANVVAGTIHGESPYAVFDRLVNDLQVPRTSFKATDVVVVANKLRTPDQLYEVRRVVSVTEIRKHWEEDPLKEKGFVTLMDYDAAADEIKPTRDLIEGESEVLKSIASRVRDWVGNWDRVWENILLRARIKEMLVSYARKLRRFDILEADFNADANDAFHKIFEKLRREQGYPNSRDVVREFEEWLKVRLKSKG